MKTTKINFVLSVLAALFMAILLIQGGYFLSDDFDILYSAYRNNKLDNNGWLNSGIFIRPFVMLTWQWSYEWFGLNPKLYYGLHLSIHAINSYLVYKIAREITSNVNIALLATSVFLIHPIHGSSIGWLSVRFDLICATFYFLTILSFCKLHKTAKLIYSPLVIVSTVLALASKEMAIMLPVILLTTLIVMEGNLKKVRPLTWLTLLFSLIVIGCYFLIRLGIYNNGMGGYGSHTDISSDSLKVITHSFRALVNPINFDYLSLVHDYFPTLISAVLVIIFMYLLFWKVKNNTKLTYLLMLLFIVSCIPLINISKVYENMESSRLYYIPSLYFSILIAVLLSKTSARMSTLYITILMSLSISYAALWANAGQSAKEILNSASHLPPTCLNNIKDLPDNHYGAFVFRNGFTNAHRLLYETTSEGSDGEINCSKHNPIYWQDESKTFIHNAQ